MLRMRLAEAASEGHISFDHEVLRRLHAAGLPVPLPRPTGDGKSWVCDGERCYELLGWVTGCRFDRDDLQSIFQLGRFLAQFHLAMIDSSPPGKEGALREDHPDLLRPYIGSIRELCSDSSESGRLSELEDELDATQRDLDESLYTRLPHSIIHGDIHPGNLRFHDSRVSAVYDFDYVSWQSRARDLCDGLMFFAGFRPSTLNPDDIWSLTQPFQLELHRSILLLEGYKTLIVLDEGEWEALPLLIRSRWIQMRLRGSRKVPRSERVRFVLEPFRPVIHWLDNLSAKFFEELHEQICAPSPRSDRNSSRRSG